MLLLIAGACFWRFWVRDLTYFDEPRYAEVARETALSGSWLIPRLYGALYTEKPPLWFWCVGQLGSRLGFGSFAIFLTNVLCHFATCLLVFDLARRLVSRRAGELAALAFAACPLVLHYARSAQLDSMLAFGEALAAWGLLLALQSGRFGFALAGCAGLAVGTMIKGHIAFVALLAPLSWCWVHRDWRWLRRPLRLLAGALVAIGPLLLWCAAIVREMGWPFFRDRYLLRQTVERLAGGEHYAPVPVGAEYLAALMLMLPMIAFLPGAIRDRGASSVRRSLLLWALLYFAIFALTPSKRELYLLPLAVPIALAVGDWLAALEAGAARPFRWLAKIGIVLALVIGAGAIGLPIVIGVASRGDAFSLDSVLMVAAAPLAWLAVQAFRTRARGAPFLLLASLSVLMTFGEPAVGAWLNSRFTLRRFGERIQEAVPVGAMLVVYNYEKAHRIRWFGEREIEFADDLPALRARLAEQPTRFVVIRLEDLDQLLLVGLDVRTLAVEDKHDRDAFVLLAAHRRG